METRVDWFVFSLLRVDVGMIGAPSDKEQDRGKADGVRLMLDDLARHRRLDRSGPEVPRAVFAQPE